MINGKIPKKKWNCPRLPLNFGEQAGFGAGGMSGSLVARAGGIQMLYSEGRGQRGITLRESHFQKNLIVLPKMCDHVYESFR
jgi:hypothetical protein